MEEILISIVGIIFGFALGLLMIIVIVKSVPANPGYDEWLTNDKAEYPEDYK